MKNETPVETDSLPSPGDGASQVPATADTGAQTSSHRLVPAVVRGPFKPVAYVLVDEHLLLPAIWHDSAKPAPATGDVVTVRLPCGRPTPQMLPLTAYQEQPETAPPTAVPSVDTASEDAANPEETSAPEDTPAPEEAASADAAASSEASRADEPENAQPSKPGRQADVRLLAA